MSNLRKDLINYLRRILFTDVPQNVKQTAQKTINLIRTLDWKKIEDDFPIYVVISELWISGIGYNT